MRDRADELLRRIARETGAQPTPDLEALVAQAVAAGLEDGEIVAAASRGALGVLLLDVALRPPGETVPIGVFVARSGLDPLLVRDLWLAFGLPATGDVAAGVTPDTAEAITLMAALTERFSADEVLGLARVIGAATSQLANALASATRVGFEMPQRDTGTTYAEINAEIRDVARELLPALWDAVGAIFRRHIVLVSNQSWQPDAARTAITVIRTVGFVDLVGSTDVLRSQSVAEIAASVDAFERLVWNVVTRAGGRVVKLIGDEAMFVVTDPAAACRLAARLVAGAPQAVRVGLAHGESVAIHGDYYGPTVNLAARLVAVAEPGTILVDDAVCAAVSGEVDLEPVDIGSLPGFPDITRAHRVAGGPR